jgi:hypothetical protein
MNESSVNLSQSSKEAYFDNQSVDHTGTRTATAEFIRQVEIPSYSQYRTGPTQ